MLAGNKSSMIFEQGGKLNARKTSISRGNAKDHGTYIRVGGARKRYFQQYGENVQLRKSDQSGQAMPHGRFSRTKAPKDVGSLPRENNTCSSHWPKPELRPNRDRGVSNKDVRTRSNYDFKNFQSRVKPAVTSHTVH
ncbi:unnamed protein product [Linum trigynum]|uniref:Uncharacterized protein n=1 Tax=Linum trigynum TaxID=586398 RepID=A0AAV2EUV6_9ROSI